MARRSRLSLTLLASVLVHAALLAVAARDRPDEGEARAVAPIVLEMEVVYAPPKPVARPVPAPVKPPPSLASAQPSRRAPRPAQPAPVAPREVEPPAPGSAEPRAEDVPRAAPPPSVLTLLPKDFPGGVAVGEAPPSRGQTVRNLPGEAPDPEAVAAYQAEEAKARVDGWMSDTLAVARAERGAPSPYFQRMKAAFAEQLVDPPPPDLKGIASRMKREQVEAIQRFGKTGSPVVAPEKREHRDEQKNRLLAAAEAGRATPMYMVDVTAPVLALAAVVEVWQEPSGNLRDLKVLQSSGDKTFDAWAISRLRDALARTGAPPESGVGIRDEGIRSRWQLEEYLGNPRVQIRLLGVY